MAALSSSDRQVIAVAPTRPTSLDRYPRLHMELQPLGAPFLGRQPEIRLQTKATKQETVEGRRQVALLLNTPTREPSGVQTNPLRR